MLRNLLGRPLPSQLRPLVRWQSAKAATQPEASNVGEAYTYCSNLVRCAASPLGLHHVLPLTPRPPPMTQHGRAATGSTSTARASATRSCRSRSGAPTQSCELSTSRPPASPTRSAPRENDPPCPGWAARLSSAAPLQVTGELQGRLRLEWWRSAVDAAASGEPSLAKHPVVIALAVVLREHPLIDPRYLHDVIEARQRALDPAQPQEIYTLEKYGEDTASALLYALLQSAGVQPATRVPC